MHTETHAYTDTCTVNSYLFHISDKVVQGVGWTMPLF